MNNNYIIRINYTHTLSPKELRIHVFFLKSLSLTHSKYNKIQCPNNMIKASRNIKLKHTVCDD